MESKLRISDLHISLQICCKASCGRFEIGYMVAGNTIGDLEMKLYEENMKNYDELLVTIIGAGGIGSNLIPHLTRSI